MIRHPIDYLEYIWQKPERTRKKIAAISVVTLLSMIVGAWFMTVTFSANIDNEIVDSPIASVWKNLKDTASIYSTHMTQSIKDLNNNLNQTSHE